MRRAMPKQSTSAKTSVLSTTESQKKKKISQTHIFRVDMSDRKDIYAAAALVVDKVGDVDIVVNNAGILRDPGDFLAKTDETIEKTIQINMLAHMWMAKAFLPRMLERDSGHIVCICSLSGIVGAKNIADYSASKFGAFGFQEALENEMYERGRRHIQFTTVCPSYIGTPMIKDIKLPSTHSILSSDSVAEEIVYAVLTGRRIVLLPRKAYLLYALKGFLPRRTFQRFLLFMQNR
ncbi:unnamed protein product [Nippostrongylus brasiliensis]|uniref:Retinol dehydrogenase 10 (inferred by orthology to a human protein) n=1 Tax=Nippostrongylus brasiliensis TaxID=27835 RepID=A0A0N4YJM3_NIPBR|nr:unnamed protein product [Nippostrongylus brasiliensis]